MRISADEYRRAYYAGERKPQAAENAETVQGGNVRSRCPVVPGWVNKIRSAARALLSARVPQAVRHERDATCDSCEFMREAEGGLRYCGCCGCGRWQLGAAGSHLQFKNGLGAWSCPVGKFGEWSKGE